MSAIGEKSADPSETEMRYRIGVLLYFRCADGRILLIKRRRSPNAGLWCAIGGKLEMATGESPYECAKREAREEVGITLDDADLNLRCMLSEENYENSGHWLMFVFLIDIEIGEVPDEIDEGEFSFFEEAFLDKIEMPKLDRHILKNHVLREDLGLVSLHAPVGAESDPELLRLFERMS